MRSGGTSGRYNAGPTLRVVVLIDLEQSRLEVRQALRVGHVNEEDEEVNTRTRRIFRQWQCGRHVTVGRVWGNVSNTGP